MMVWTQVQRRGEVAQNVDPQGETWKSLSEWKQQGQYMDTRSNMVISIIEKL